MSEASIPSEVVQERCRGLIKHIKKFPLTFNMDMFMRGTKIDAEHPCGTVGCLAGTLVFLHEGPLSGKVTHDEWDPNSQYSCSIKAAKLLEIDQDVASTLWYESEWPDHLGYKANGYWATPEEGIKRIEYFMETGK